MYFMSIICGSPQGRGKSGSCEQGRVGQNIDFLVNVING